MTLRQIIRKTVKKDTMLIVAKLFFEKMPT